MGVNPWIYIAAGGIIEAVWATTMNETEGFTVPSWSVLTFLISLVSVWFLYCGLKLGLPTGTAYAAWTGCGTVCSTVFGILFYDQMLGAVQFLFLALLIGGILLLQVAEGRGKKPAAGEGAEGS
ncbi:quaternary ammonium compound-resistance protein sugE [Candidatus Methanomethylophilus sp. 1R26]|uniref:DMT family transporter n=1 Tax=Candidatus Methanomethylophilus sp. 1R26 TaxID=1769296 RepID=UPI000735FECD|nr:SMR family transporter [Candidatus Methanomethylophilus sp. 1R26]KUE73515.1 quaternary ammonium compound-resistance protein sugE [Candidatus Methanomethylophilus sp. 1R26]